MKITAKKKASYEIFLDGENLGEFKVASEWEGFLKLVSSKGTIIASKGDHNSFENIISMITGQETGEREFDVIMISPSLRPAATTKNDDKEE